MSTTTIYYETPIGIAKIVGDEHGIQSVSVLPSDAEEAVNSETPRVVPQCLQDCAHQLEEYFHGNRTEFDLKLNPQGTDF